MAYIFFWNCSTSLGWGHSNLALLSIFLVLIIGSCAGVSEFVFQFTLPAIEHTVIRLSEPCSDSVIPLSKAWHQRLSAVWPSLPSQHNIPFSSAWHSRQSGLLIILWLPVAFLPLLVLTHVLPCGKSILSSCLVILSKPFLSFVTQFRSHMLLDYSSWEWSLFSLCFSFYSLVILAGTYHRLLCI